MTSATELCFVIMVSLFSLGKLHRTGCTHLKHIPLHPPRLFFVLQPPLGPPLIRILPKRRLITMQHPSVGSNARASGEEMTIQLCAFWRYKPCDVQSDSGTDAHGFFETGLQVRQVLGLVPGKVTRGGDDTRRNGGLDLGKDRSVGGGRGEDVVEEGLHC